MNNSVTLEQDVATCEDLGISDPFLFKNDVISHSKIFNLISKFN